MAEVASVVGDRTRDSLGRRKSPGRPLKRRPPGRTGKYHPDIGRAICREIANSVPMSVAAGIVGATPAMVGSWYAKGCDNPHGKYGAFARNVAKAQSIAVKRQLKNVTKSARGGQVIRKTTTDPEGGTTVVETELAPQWQAGKWLLEVTDRESFGPRQTIDSTQRVEQIALNVSANLSDGDLGKLAELLARLKGGNETAPAKAGAIIVESGQANGQRLAGTLNSLDRTSETIGNVDIPQPLAPQGGNLTIPAGQPGE